LVAAVLVHLQRYLNLLQDQMEETQYSAPSHQQVVAVEVLLFPPVMLAVLVVELLEDLILCIELEDKEIGGQVITQYPQYLHQWDTVEVRGFLLQEHPQSSLLVAVVVPVQTVRPAHQQQQVMVV
jgi:hypothetical protein